MDDLKFKASLEKISNGHQITFTGQSLSQIQIEEIKKAIDIYVVSKIQSIKNEYDDYFRCVRARLSK
jgi:hypothetical protein